MKRRDFLKGIGIGALGVHGLHFSTKVFARDIKGAVGSIPKRPFGNTGEHLSVIGFGGIVVMNAEQEHANQVVREAYERGINYYDVAPSYGNAEEKLDKEIAFLKSKQDWKNDSKKIPYALSKNRINDARKLIDRAAEVLPADDPAMDRLNEKMAVLVKMNDELHKIGAERTRMIPDRFEGEIVIFENGQDIRQSHRQMSRRRR